MSGCCFSPPFQFQCLSYGHHSEGHQETCIPNSHPLTVIIHVLYLKVLHWPCPPHVLGISGCLLGCHGCACHPSSSSLEAARLPVSEHSPVKIFLSVLLKHIKFVSKILFVFSYLSPGNFVHFSLLSCNAIFFSAIFIVKRLNYSFFSASKWVILTSLIFYHRLFPRLFIFSVVLYSIFVLFLLDQMQIKVENYFPIFMFLSSYF